MRYARVDQDHAIIEYPVDEATIRAEHPGTSFPQEMGQANLAGFGFVPVEDNPAPSPLLPGHFAVEGDPVKNAEGHWVQNWTVRDATSEELEAMRASMITRLDTIAEQQRLRYITPGAGQAMTYVAQNAEALAYIQSGGTAPTPFLSEEAEAIGKTVADLVTEVRAAAEAWQTAGAAINANRRGMKERLKAATTFADLAGIDITEGWPT